MPGLGGSAADYTIIAMLLLLGWGIGLCLRRLRRIETRLSSPRAAGEDEAA